MSKTKYFWRGNVTNMIRQYPYGLLHDGSEMAMRHYDAVLAAIENLGTYPDGELRKKAVELFYIKRTHQRPGVSMKLHASEATVQRWLSEFVDDVGKRAGYFKD